MTKVLLKYDWLSVPYAEFITRRGHTQQGSMGYGGGDEHVFSIKVHGTDLDEAVTELLGTNEHDSKRGLLIRTPPKCHPYWTQARCCNVDIIPLGRGEKSEGGTSLIGGDDGGAMQLYDFYVLRCHFKTPPWNASWSDSELIQFAGARSEWRRFVSIKPSATNEQLSHEKEEFAWTEGPNFGNPIQLQLGRTLSKVSFEVCWHRVPLTAVAGTFGGLTPEQLDTHANKVNASAFFGKPAGTLLLKGYRMQQVSVPDVVREHQLRQRGTITLMYDIYMNVLFFDPPFGDVERGHRLAPHRNGLWYDVAAVSGGRRLLEQVDFADLFAIAQD